jgi:hypothetical protein
MNTEKILIVCATVLLLVGMGACTAGNFDRRAKWAEAVKNGADPMAVNCSLSNSDATADYVLCYALANKK